MPRAAALTMIAPMSATAEPSESFQIPLEAAELYESAFVPAFFAQWAPATVRGRRRRRRPAGARRGLRDRHRRPPRRRPSSAPTGSSASISTRPCSPWRGASRGDIEWRQGDVAALPFADASFDVVVCQMALMFFPDRAAALAEMARVAGTGGTVAVLVPSALDVQPAYGPFVEMAAQHAGRRGAVAARHVLRLRRRRRAAGAVRSGGPGGHSDAP